MGSSDAPSVREWEFMRWFVEQYGAAPSAGKSETELRKEYEAAHYTFVLARLHWQQRKQWDRIWDAALTAWLAKEKLA